LQPEARLVRQIIKHLEEVFPTAQIRKRHGGPYATAGDPDIYLCVAGRHLEIEVKMPGENPTSLQNQRLVQWGRAGALTVVVHTVSELECWLERLVQGGSSGSGLQSDFWHNFSSGSSGSDWFT
jgi:hypothetical protein